MTRIRVEPTGEVTPEGHKVLRLADPNDAEVFALWQLGNALSQAGTSVDICSVCGETLTTYFERDHQGPCTDCANYREVRFMKARPDEVKAMPRRKAKAAYAAPSVTSEDIKCGRCGVLCEDASCATSGRDYTTCVHSEIHPGPCAPRCSDCLGAS